MELDATYQPVSQWATIQICIFWSSMFIYDTAVCIQGMMFVNSKFGMPKLFCFFVGWAQSKNWAAFS